MPRRNYRSHSDRLVLPVHTQPMAPREPRHRKPVDNAEMNKGKSEYLKHSNSIRREGILLSSGSHRGQDR
jgi:hypothetical protein